MSRISAVLIALGFSVAPFHLAAQAGPISGVDGERLKLGVDSMEIFLVRGSDTVSTGMAWDELSHTQWRGAPALRRIYRSRDRVLGVRVDTIIDEPGSLRPLSHRSRTARSRESLDFSSEHVVGWTYDASGDSTAVAIDIPAGVYNGSSFDLLLRAAPLSEDWAVEIPSFVASSGRVLPLRARVVEKEIIGRQDCWRVDGDFGGTPVTFWIEEQSRDLCQQVMEFGPGIHILFRRFTQEFSTRQRPA